MSSDTDDLLPGILLFAEKAVPLLVQADPDESEGQSFFTRLKFVSETCLLLYAVIRTEDRELAARALDIGQSLAPHARRPEILAWVHFRPHLLAELTVAHYCLKKIGVEDPIFDHQLNVFAQMTSVGARERVPWKDLEDGWHRALGAPSPDVDIPAALKRTAISQVQDALFASREDGYAFTHALIYATDFGHQQLPDNLDKDAIIRDAASLLARCLEEDDFDLGAEALMAWPLMKMPLDSLANFALDLFETLTRTIGILPSMSLRNDEYQELSAEAATRYFFKEGYHTAYVMGLLLAAMRTPNARQLAVEGPLPQSCNTARRLYDLLPERFPQRQWEVHFNALNSAQQAALTPLIAEIFVRRTVKSADYEGLRTGLEIFLASGHVFHRGVEQSVELLGRMTVAARGDADGISNYPSVDRVSEIFGAIGR